MNRFVVFFVLLTVSSSFSQDWRWERFTEDFYDPMDFPFHIMSVGDFDGNGEDEILSIDDGYFCFNFPRHSGDSLRWIQGDPFAVFGDVYLTYNYFPIDLDSIPGEELIVDRSACWKLALPERLIWEERSDLLDPLFLPDNSLALLYGDYDDNGLLNAVGVSAGIGVSLYERNTEGTWTILNEWRGNWIDGGYDGDFDHDGDTDFAVCHQSYADPSDPATILFENRGSSGVLIHDEDIYMMPYVYPMGGDLDCDGEWEGIYYPFTRYGNLLLEVAPADTAFVVPTESWTLNRFYLSFSGTSILGNLRCNGSTFIAAAYGLHYYTFPGGDAFWTEIWTPRGRKEIVVGFADFGLYHTTHTSRGDFDGDGKLDLIAELYSSFGENRSWWLKQNTGDEFNDYFSSAGVSFSRFTQNSDTLFTWPCLGDVNGDGLAELILLSFQTGDATRVRVFEFAGEGGETEFHLNESLSANLPVWLYKIRTADLDGDGITELVGTIGDGNWSVFFFRNGRWQDYSHIFPDIYSTEIGFADFDNDGDLDLFTDEDVWISLSPTPVSDDFNPQPSSFSLASYPNPFNPTTTIRFDLPDAARVSLDIFNVTGQKVQSLVNQQFTAGSHTIDFDGSSLPSGVYFANLRSGTELKTIKLLLMK